MSSQQPRPRRRLVSLWLGGILMCAGLGLLGHFAWQIWGTNWVSQRKHAEITATVEDAWSRPSRTEPVTFADTEVTALIRVPRFGDDYVVPVLEGTTDEVLAAGYGHFPGSADAGDEGNYAIAAHRVTHGEPLRRMAELVPGDEVVIETHDATYTYVMDSGGDDLRVPLTETWVVDSLPDNPDDGEPEPAQRTGQRLLTLTTCSELFHSDYRWVAFGHLVSVEPS